jgi:hypothetical protein
MRALRRTLALSIAALALCALPAAPAAGAEAWWQVLSSSRPSNLQPAPDQSEVQEVKSAKAELGVLGTVLVSPVAVGGKAVGCLGIGALFIYTANQICEEETGFPATETSAALGELLEGEALYDGEVQLAGAALGEGSFTLATPGRWVPALELGPPVVVPNPVEPSQSVTLGSASSEVVTEGSGRVVATLTNLGNAPVLGSSTAIEIVDRLPEGVAAYRVQAEAGGQGKAGPIECTIGKSGKNSLVSCSFEDELPPYEAIEVEVLVALGPGADGGEAGEVSVSGGDGPEASESQNVNVSPAQVPFGLEHFSMRAEEEGGEETHRAGSHPFQLTTTIVANSGAQSGADRREARVGQPALPRNLRFTLPAGLVGDATAVGTCDLATFLRQTSDLVNECPDRSAVGVSSVTIVESAVFGLVRLAVPVFNLPPRRGEPARFGLMVAGVPVVIDTALDPDREYRIAAEVRNISQVAQFLSSTTTLWGTPGDDAHDASRGWNCAYFGAESLPGDCLPPSASERDESPFLRMPASCTAPLSYEAAFEAWNAGEEDQASYQSEGPLSNCSGVPFAPEIVSTLTSRLAATPSGQDFQLLQPGADFGNTPRGTPDAQAKTVEVTLPEGVTLNPSAAEGLAVCSPEAYARERQDSAPGEGCPEASRVGSLEVASPLIAERLEGSLYVAEPYRNPTGGLIAVYLVVRSPERGILVKQPLAGSPDERTGRLRFTAENVPPLPFTALKLHLREGARAPLITPPGCGTFHTVARFVLWSAADPEHPDPAEVVTGTAPFLIDRGTDGGACPSGEPPFNPGFEAGTLNNQAGSYSPFLMRLTRKDGEQDMGRFSFTLPPGVVPKLAGIPYCSEAGIARARARTGAHGGTEELDDPSCPAASQIGRTVAGAGVGNQLTYVSGSLYLAGPYNGNPISAVAITPAVAGPFDAGTVVVREGLRLNPVTHRGEVDGAGSDPIPHILKGIPLNLRDLRVYADRPEFTLNATSCDPSEASTTIWGEGTVLQPLGATPATLSSRYQAAGCAGLGFKPRLGLKLRGGTRRGAFPALQATYRPRAGHANLSRLALTFPTSAFIEQGHFRTICTRVQFASGPGFGANCPKGSIYGRVKAWSPLLDEPLQGPVYLRSSNHNLPDAVLALHGLVEIEVATRIDSVNGRLRAIVGNVPDAPVSKAVVRMRGGQKGLFVNSRNLCQKAGRNRARVNLRGQNSKRLRARPPMRALGCKRKRAHKSHLRPSAT